MDTTKQVITITVDGGYTPNVVQLKRGLPAELRFVRRSERGCLGTVQSADLGFKTDLPLDQPQTVTVDTSQVREFDFSCGMNMVHGKVVVD